VGGRTSSVTDEQLDAVLSRVEAGLPLSRAAGELNLSRHAVARALASRRPDYKSRWTKHRPGTARVSFDVALNPDLFARLERHTKQARMTRTEIVNMALRQHLGMTEAQ
jgi:hypothetical protein